MINRTVTATLEASRDDVFSFLSKIENLPLWATDFARELRLDDDEARVVNGLGEFYVSFDADGDTGVIDMYAGPAPDAMALFPTRVVALGPTRSAYSFTMFKPPEMPDELFESQYLSLLREFDNIRVRFANEAEGCAT